MNVADVLADRELRGARRREKLAELFEQLRRRAGQLQRSSDRDSGFTIEEVKFSSGDEEL
jgi:hypothetical protein